MKGRKMEKNNTGANPVCARNRALTDLQGTMPKRTIIICDKFKKVNRF